MSDYDFTAAYARILEVTGEKSQSGLARVLSVTQSSVWDVVRRGKDIPPSWLLVLVERYNVSPLWIKTGEGPQRMTRALENYSLEELHAELGRRLMGLFEQFGVLLSKLKEPS